MTDPHDTGLNLNDRSGRSTWAWIAGIAAVILVAFIVAAVWNGNPRTASKAPTETTGMGTTTQAVPPPATTGQAPGAPVIAPSNTAPNTLSPQKTPPPLTPAPATPAPQ